MKEQLKKHQGTATWSSAIMALALLGSEVTDLIKDTDGDQDNTDTQIMSVVGEKYAAYSEWKKAATDDIKELRAKNDKLMGEVAALTAVVNLLSHGNRREAAPLAAVVYESTRTPAPQPVSSPTASDTEGYDVLEVTVEKPSPRGRARTVIKKKRIKHEAKASRKIEISREQVRQSVKELFK